MPSRWLMLVTPLAARRFRGMLETMRADFEGQRGWMSAAARLLGVHRSTISKLLADERAVTSELVTRAGEALGIAPEYWTTEQGSYRDFPSNDGDRWAGQQVTEGRIADVRRRWAAVMGEAKQFEQLPGHRAEDADRAIALAKAVFELPLVEHAGVVLARQKLQTPEEQRTTAVWGSVLARAVLDSAEALGDVATGDDASG